MLPEIQEWEQAVGQKGTQAVAVLQVRLPPREAVQEADREVVQKCWPEELLPGPVPMFEVLQEADPAADQEA